jgi:hypothetical protein
MKLLGEWSRVGVVAVDDQGEFVIAPELEPTIATAFSA